MKLVITRDNAGNKKVIKLRIAGEFVVGWDSLDDITDRDICWIATLSRSRDNITCQIKSLKERLDTFDHASKYGFGSVGENDDSGIWARTK